MTFEPPQFVADWLAAEFGLIVGDLEAEPLDVRLAVGFKADHEAAYGDVSMVDAWNDVSAKIAATLTQVQTDGLTYYALNTRASTYDLLAEASATLLRRLRRQATL